MKLFHRWHAYTSISSFIFPIRPSRLIDSNSEACCKITKNSRLPDVVVRVRHMPLIVNIATTMDEQNDKKSLKWPTPMLSIQIPHMGPRKGMVEPVGQYRVSCLVHLWMSVAPMIRPPQAVF